MILTYYNNYTGQLIKSTLILVDFLSIKFNIPRKYLGYIIAIIHSALVSNVFYVIFLQNPDINLYYYLYNYLLWFVTISNIILRGCILVKIERHLFNDKNYIGPVTYFVKLLSNSFGIYNIKNIILIQNILAGMSFCFSLYVSHNKLNSNNIINEI